MLPTDRGLRPTLAGFPAELTLIPPAFCADTELTMKIITTLTTALLATALLGCTQQASNAPTAARPAATPAAETNTFGESTDQTASNAAKAREAQYGNDAPK
jgi:hypothetical protein